MSESARQPQFHGCCIANHKLCDIGLAAFKLNKWIYLLTHIYTLARVSHPFMRRKFCKHVCSWWTGVGSVEKTTGVRFSWSRCCSIQWWNLECQTYNKWLFFLCQGFYWIWCYPDFRDLGAVQSNGEIWNASKHSLASCPTTLPASSVAIFGKTKKTNNICV